MTSPYFYFDAKKLQELAEANRDAYAAGDPFPHIVIDGILPDDVIDRVIEEFPSPEGIAWREFHAPMENKKLAAENDELMGPFTRHLMGQLNGAAFASFLDTLTGIPGLIPDPYLKGGGLHQIVRGGSLGVHADFNRYKRLNLNRRVNALIYLNKGWKEEWGGHLELWNADMTKCAKKVAPIANRLVVFSTTDTAYHGHPDPLQCPEGVTRKSLALYYYTAGAPETAAHSTIFRARPGKDEAAPRAKDVIKKFVPPIVLDAMRALRR